MQSIGEDFDLLTITLKDYGAALIEQGLLADAISVLEFGVAIGTDISQNYNMLGDCYLALGKTDKISYLIEQVESRNLLLAPSILRHLPGAFIRRQHRRSRKGSGEFRDKQKLRPKKPVYTKVLFDIYRLIFIRSHA